MTTYSIRQHNTRARKIRNAISTASTTLALLMIASFILSAMYAIATNPKIYWVIIPVALLSGVFAYVGEAIRA